MEEEDDVIDRLRSKQKLTASHIVHVIELFIQSRSDTVALVDPGFLALYMKRPTPHKHINTMIRVFSGERHRPIVLIPLHSDGHWSLLVYFARYTTFFYLDSLEEYHNAYVTRVLAKLVEDNVIIDVAATKMTTIKSEIQAFSYECGQYVFMFLHAFLLSHEADTLPYDRDGFVNILQGCVRERCREQHRQAFIQRIVHWIHEERGF